MRDPLYENKLIAALLVAGLIVFTVPILMQRMCGNSEHIDAIEARRSAEATRNAEAQVKNTEISLAERLANANPETGQRTAALCKACHSFDKDGPQLLGPPLWGVVGRLQASDPDAIYSPAFRALEGTWSPEELDVFLKAPGKYAPGTSMLIGISNAEKRADIIAYLMTLTD